MQVNQQPINVEVKITPALAEALVEYLAARPFKEVAELVAPLVRARQVAEQTSLKQFLDDQKAEAVRRDRELGEEREKASFATEVAASINAAKAVVDSAAPPVGLSPHERANRRQRRSTPPPTIEQAKAAEAKRELPASPRPPRATRANVPAAATGVDPTLAPPEEFPDVRLKPGVVPVELPASSEEEIDE